MSEEAAIYQAQRHQRDPGVPLDPGRPPHEAPGPSRGIVQISPAPGWFVLYERLDEPGVADAEPLACWALVIRGSDLVMVGMSVDELGIGPADIAKNFAGYMHESEFPRG